MSLLRALCCALVLASTLGCGQDGRARLDATRGADSARRRAATAIDAGIATTQNGAGKLPEPRIPDPGGMTAPSMARIPTGQGVDGNYLADVELCSGCHPDAFAQQQSSAHAFASFNNPIYRGAVERLRDEAGLAASHACGGCHDAALLVDGAMDRAVAARDPRAHNGVSCRLCHGIVTASRTGNGSYVLDARPIPLPKDGNAASLLAHRKAAAPPPMAELCGSCHQSFLSPATGNAQLVPGQSELLSWADSPYNGSSAGFIDEPVDPASCVDCHMAPEDAPLGDVAADDEHKISSHRFLGSHTWLAAMRNDEVQLERTRAFLRGAASVAVHPVEANGEGSLLFDVVVRNLRTGHRFPSGVRDVTNVWIDVEVYDAKGRLRWHSSRDEGDEVHELRALVADDSGQLLEERETNHFAATVADNTIAPRDAVVVRYRATDAGKAARVRVRLLHQSRGLQLARRACLDHRDPRGREMQAAGKALERDIIDPCRPQPITEIAAAEWKPGTHQRESWKALYEHGLGWLHAVQEQADQARPSLLAALDGARAAKDDLGRAAVLVALARLEARLGRVDAMQNWLRQAEALAPPRSVFYAVEGDAYSRTWRWEEAATAYRRALDLSEGNASLWSRYSVALGSAGQDEEALAATRQGLALRPLDVDMLRVQALSWKALASDSPQATRAMKAYLAYRGLDNVGAVRLRCAQKSSLCDREQEPVHEHLLRAGH